MSDLPQITISDFGIPFFMDEEIKKEDSTINPTADVAYWPNLQDDLTFPHTVPLPPSPTIPPSPALSSSSTSYGNDQALPSPSNLPIDIPQADRPVGWGDWMHQCKEVSNAMAYRSPQEDANSNFAEETLSTSPGSGPYDDSLHSPASSPGVHNMSLQVETMFANNFGLKETSSEFLSPRWEGYPGAQPSTSVPSSPNLLPNNVGSLMRSRSHRTLGHQYSSSDTTFLSVSSAAPGGTMSGPFLEASDRGRGRNRAYTAPNSRRASPYPPMGRPTPPQEYSLTEMEHLLSFSQSSQRLHQQRPDALSISTQFYVPDQFPYLSPPATSEDGFSSPPDSTHSPADSIISESPVVSKAVVTTMKTRLASEVKRIHEQKFECPFCPERFTTKNKRDRHVDAHRGIKRFPCEKPGCAKAFTSSADRKRHQENPKHP